MPLLNLLLTHCEALGLEILNVVKMSKAAKRKLYIIIKTLPPLPPEPDNTIIVAIIRGAKIISVEGDVVAPNILEIINKTVITTQTIKIVGIVFLLSLELLILLLY